MSRAEEEYREFVGSRAGHWQRYGGLPARAGTDRPEVAVPDICDEVVNRADLLHALLTLPARQRATVVLRYLEGMSERETAAVMRCSEGTVKSQTSRALSALGGCLEHKESPA
jgi:DNA-directed RNA polymerase specialized sigma24 family protein